MTVRSGIAVAVASLMLLCSGCGSVPTSDGGDGGFAPHRYTEQPLIGGSGNPRECRSYFGGDVGAVICNQRRLEDAWVNHQMLAPSSLHVAVEGASRLSSAGGNPGLVQVMLEQGWPFEPNSKLILSGKAPPGTVALVSARDMSRGLDNEAIVQALFRNLGLVYGGRATITIRRHGETIAIVLTRPDGTKVAPDVVYEHRADPE